MQRYVLISLAILFAPLMFFWVWRSLNPNRSLKTRQVFDVLLLLGALAVAVLLFASVLIINPPDTDTRNQVEVPAYMSVDGELIDGFFVPVEEFTTREAARQARGLPPALPEGQAVQPKPTPSTTGTADPNGGDGYDSGTDETDG